MNNKQTIEEMENEIEEIEKDILLKSIPLVILKKHTSLESDEGIKRRRARIDKLKSLVIIAKLNLPHPQKSKKTII